MSFNNKIINQTIIILFFLLLSLTLSTFFIDSQNNIEQPVYPTNEKFDRKLTRLNSLNSMISYWDSMTSVTKPKNAREHVWLANNLVMNRFYHDYSHYSFQENPIAYLSGKMVWNNLSAIVIPDDILKYEMAACSQQCIVLMELIKLKGYKVRKIGFIETNGHFCMEVFYDNSWHFYDPNKEPSILKNFPDYRPSIEILLKDKNNLYKAYENKMTKQEVDAVFGKYVVGATNSFPAKNAKAFHIVTYFISFYGWAITLGLLAIFNYRAIVKK